ncbi:MAG: homoaconitate hydratase [Candidatus Thermoplasmatota archaeon]
MEEIVIHNYNVEANLKRSLPEKIYFWDETLRDGEQTPGVFFTLDEKVELAKILDEIGIEIINCGIPAISEGEKKAVKAIANEGLRAKVLGACRTLKSDIDACLDADVDEVSPFIACSDVHMKYKLRMSKEEVIKRSVEAIEYSKAHGLRTTFVTEDTVRADINFVEKLYNSAIDAHVDRVLFCDTVGVMTPFSMKWWLDEVKKRIKKVQLGIHVHNDFGMATANTLTALECGVEVPNTTLNGIGERAGNCSFEEVVLSLEFLYNYRTGIKIEKIYELSKLVEEYSGIPISIGKPIVGYNAFTHESGIHTDGVIKNTLTYEPINCELINRERRFVFGKHTGASAVLERLKNKGIELEKEKIIEIVGEIKNYTEKKDKSKIRSFIMNYRRWDEMKGLDDEKFMEIVRNVIDKKM